MENQFQTLVHEPNLLRVLIQIHEWEDRQQQALQTLSGRNLYFRLASSYLDVSQSPQQLKCLQGRTTERATRQRMREFQELGLVDISNHESDQRSKTAIPTEKFLLNLNQHLDQIKHMCDQRFLMLDKND